MEEIATVALLTASAALGCLSFRYLLGGRKSLTTWEQVTSSVGISGFLSAVGFVLEQHGVIPVALLLLLTWLIYDTVERAGLNQAWLVPSAWLSLALVFVYISVGRVGPL